MQAYGWNKTISLGIPLLILLFGLLLFDENDTRLWWILIVITHSLGYIHFILGYVYQYRSLRRQGSRKKFLIFSLMTVVATLFALWFIYIEQIALLAIVAVGYFVIHGTLNELTLMNDQMGFAPKPELLLPFVLYITPFFLYSVTHPAFFYNSKFEFSNPSPDTTVQLLERTLSIELVFLLALFMLLLFLVLVPFRLLMQGHFVAGGVILAVTLLSSYTLVAERPFNYVFLYFIALSYHFISWSLYFYQKFSVSAPERVTDYVRHHLYLGVPLILLSVGAYLAPLGSLHLVHMAVFNGLLFLIMAMIHNTTSFLNEKWFLKLINEAK